MIFVEIRYQIDTINDEIAVFVIPLFTFPIVNEIESRDDNLIQV